MSKLNITLVHPTGNPNVRNAVQALAESALLNEVITTLAFDPKSSLINELSILPKRTRQPLYTELARRAWLKDIDASVQQHPWCELFRLAIVKTGLSHILGFGASGPIDWVYTMLDSHTASHHLQGINALYAYEDGAATTFAQAKTRNILCLYDLPIMFYRMAHTIQAEEAEYFPEFGSVLQAVREPNWKLERKEQEVQLADHIFVASSITLRSLLEAGVKPEKITVIPYGAPVDYFQPRPKVATKFRALFVGRVGPRKGIHYLLRAWQTLKLPEAELAGLPLIVKVKPSAQ